MITKTVIIENYLLENPNKVCVYEFDKETGQVLIDIEVCSKDEAFNKYNVVGEIENGNILLYNSRGLDEEPEMFDAQETDRIILYICKGISGQVYDVIYDKLEDKYLCKCNNIRNNMCYHKLAAHKLRTGEWFDE